MIEKRQFKGFSIWGFSDFYSLDFSRELDDLHEKISDFFQSRKAKKIEEKGFVFVRGNRFWTWFSFWSELWPYQHIHIKEENNKLLISYIVHGGIWIRFPPYQFEKEIVELEKFLSKI